MKVRVTQPILNLDRTPIKTGRVKDRESQVRLTALQAQIRAMPEADQAPHITRLNEEYAKAQSDVTVGLVMIESLLADLPEDKTMPPLAKLGLLQTAQRIHDALEGRNNTDEVELTSAEIVTIQERAAKTKPPLMSGQVYLITEGRPVG